MAGIHRAKPFNNKNYVRKSLYFEVNALENNGEKILVNTKFLNNLKIPAKFKLTYKIFSISL